MKPVSIQRVYDYQPGDGQAVLVDRIWPRGKSKASLEGVTWLKDVAPSQALRQWFGHRPERWAEFRRRYFAELKANPAVDELRALAGKHAVTLLYGARDEAHNQAVALRDFLTGEPV